MKLNRSISLTGKKLHRESGQTTIFVLLMMGIFFLAFIGLSVDYSNLWFHRQMAQTAADAGCQAGAMDMMVNAVNGTTLGNFPSPLAAFDCTGFPTSTPCSYASLNGYPSSTLTSDAPGISVHVSFPASVSGITTPPASLAPTPFMKVAVKEQASIYFSGLLLGRHTQTVGAVATCGLVEAKSPIPIIILNPTIASALSTQGNPDIVISGGSKKSIQVNSKNVAAVNIGGSSKIDLSKGGPSGTGSDLGVFGGPVSAPGGFITGTTGAWREPSSPVSDPFALLAIPTVPGTTGTITSVAYGVDGCPDKGGCDEYFPGNYSGGIAVKNKTAIFNPGIYYVTGGMALQANSTVRPTNNTTGIGGTIFYFAGSGSISVDSNSGKDLTLDAFATSRVQCPGGPAPTGLPATLSGNILLGPCTGTYGDPNGQYRGMLFFQDRSATSVNPGWGGGGQFLLAGTMYFHSCNSDGSGTAPCGLASAYSDTFNLSGNSGSGTYVLGEIVTDILQLGGTSGINMTLNPNASFSVLKVELLQ
jgi:hypothetical protein